MGDNVSTDYSIDEIGETLEAVAGAPILLTLDRGQIAGYVELTNLELELDAIVADYRKRFAHKVAEHSDHVETPQDVFNYMATEGFFETEEEAVDMFEKSGRYDELRATFWYAIRTQISSERPNVWNEWLSVRTGFRVVSLGKKYEAGARE